MTAKTKNIIAWILTGLVGLAMLFSGANKLMSNPEIVQKFLDWGYSDNFRLFIGAAEVAGAIGLLIPKLRTLAIGGLAIIMAGAVYTHIAQGEPTQMGPAFGFLVFLIAIYFLRRPNVVS